MAPSRELVSLPPLRSGCCNFGGCHLVDQVCVPLFKHPATPTLIGLCIKFYAANVGRDNLSTTGNRPLVGALETEGQHGPSLLQVILELE